MPTSTSSTGALPIALTLITAGSIMVYTAFRGVSVVDVFSGNLGLPTTTPSPSPDALDSGQSTPAETPAQAVPGVGEAVPRAGAGTTTIDGHPVANWVAAQVLCARRNGWTGSVLDGVRDAATQRADCIRICGNPNGCPGRCAKPGTSNHRGTVFPLGAVDVTDPSGFVSAGRKCPTFQLRNNLPNDRGHMSFTGG